MKFYASIVGISICLQSMLYAVHYSYYDPRTIVDNSIEEDLDRSISLYSGYFESQYNNHDLASFGVEMLNAGDYLLQKIDDDSRWKNALGTTLFCYLYYQYQVAFHEMGHGLKCRAMKEDFQLCTTKRQGGSFSKSENFWGYMLKRTFSFQSGGFTRYANVLNNDKDDLIVSAGGVNNETYLGERISNAIYNEKLYGRLPAAAYIWSKLSPLLYSLSNSSPDDSSHDINNIVNKFKALNINVSKSNIQMAYVVSMIGGTSLSIFRTMIDGYRHRHIEPMSFYNFRVPDIFAYITSYGVSYKFLSGYNVFDGLKLNVGFERVMHGITKNEFSFGVNGVIKNIEIESNIYLGCGGTSFEVGVSGRLSRKLKANLRLASFSNKSLMGERHTKSFYASDKTTPQSRSNMISVGISYMY